VLKDLRRILKPGGILAIRVPHFSSKSNFIDPTHKKFFSVRTFDFFVRNSPVAFDYYFDFGFSKMIARRIMFIKSQDIFQTYNYLVEPCVNWRKRTQNLYEDTGLCHLFPAECIEVELQK
jgi:SAM-dependent methyltransferase